MYDSKSSAFGAHCCYVQRGRSACDTLARRSCDRDGRPALRALPLSVRIQSNVPFNLHLLVYSEAKISIRPLEHITDTSISSLAFAFNCKTCISAPECISVSCFCTIPSKLRLLLAEKPLIGGASGPRSIHPKLRSLSGALSRVLRGELKNNDQEDSSASQF